MRSTATMIERLRTTRGFPGAAPVLLGSIYSAIRLENLLHKAGISWASRAEGVSPDADYETTLHYGQFRRWVVLVHERDLAEATRIAKEDDFPEANHLPIPFASGLCARHGYETLPCSGCHTGYDWLAKSDEEERQQVPPRHPSPL